MAGAYAAVAASSVLAAGAAEPPIRKLIATGWDSPTPARFRAELAAFEKWGVFGGTTLAPARRGPDGVQHDCRNAFSREHWERSDFTEALAELKAARPLTATDDFLSWIYGETARWWPGGRKEHPTWPEKLPGADRALQRAVNPVAAARAMLTSAKPEDNLLANPAFAEADTNGLALKWWTWQDESSHGQFTTCDGAACLKQMANGCFGQTIPVQPGERYAISSRVRKTGGGVSMVSVRWKTPEQRWTAESLDQRLSPAQRDGWNELVTLVQVPEGVGHLVVLLGVAQQTGPTDLAEFDDVRLVRIRE